jgi:hypothetical protein
MKKLMLDVDSLAVDSFPIEERIAEAGTVQALEAPTPPYYTCGCTTGASYLEAYCPPPSTRTGCVAPERK